MKSDSSNACKYAAHYALQFALLALLLGTNMILAHFDSWPLFGKTLIRLIEVLYHGFHAKAIENALSTGGFGKEAGIRAKTALTAAVSL